MKPADTIIREMITWYRLPAAARRSGKASAELRALAADSKLLSREEDGELWIAESAVKRLRRDLEFARKLKRNDAKLGTVGNLPPTTRLGLTEHQNVLPTDRGRGGRGWSRG